VFRLERLIRSGLPVSRDEILTGRGITIPEADLKAVSEWLAERGADKQVLVAMSTGSRGSSKNWPLERFLEVGARLMSNYPVQIVLVGGSGEEADAEKLIKTWGAGWNATGKLSLLGSAALLSKCRFLISVDSGPMHLAASVNVPCVSIFSAIQQPGLWDPLGPGHRVIRIPVDCAGCRSYECPVPGHPCITGISIAAVWAEVEMMCSDVGLTRKCAARKAPSWPGDIANFSSLRSVT
jgi:ADP-heptose:LPS heptosyltransferase